MSTQKLTQLPRALLFDLDGTLVDTEPSAARILLETFKEWGILLEPSDAHFITGRTWTYALDYLFKKYPLPVDRPTGEALILGRYRAALSESVIEVPGARDAVRSLFGHLPMVVVSGSRREEIHLALTGLGVLECFEFYVGAEDYPASKPDPISYLTALKRLNLSANEAMAFEDSTAGITAARAAGLWTVAITSTNHFDQDHSASQHQLEDLRAVNPDWLRQLWSQRISSRA